jgi:hypothetical protein
MPYWRLNRFTATVDDLFKTGAKELLTDLRAGEKKLS